MQEEIAKIIEDIKKDLSSTDFTRPYHAYHSLEAHFQPWYDDRKDYNTNAPSYYDYLARFNKYLRVMYDFINLLARRNVRVKETPTVNLNKNGDWTTGNEIELSANVKLSSHVQNDSINAIKIKPDGLYSPDFSNDIAKINAKILELKTQDSMLLNEINQLKTGATLLQGEINRLKSKDSDLQNQINTNKNKITDLTTQLETNKGKISDLQNKLNSFKDETNTKFEQISNAIQTLKFISSGQPPFKTIMSTRDYPQVVKNSNPTFPKTQGVGLRVSSVSYETENKRNTTTWLAINLGEMRFENVKNGNIIGEIPIDKLMEAGLTQSMINGIERFNRIVSGVTIDKRPIEFTLSKTGNNIIVTYTGGYQQGSEGISGYPRVENSLPWVEIVETDK